MDEMQETMKENQLLARKFERISKKLVGIDSPVSLFELLLTEIEKEFSVPFVWISLVADGPLADVIGPAKASALLNDRINVIDEAAFLELAGRGTKPLLANKDLPPFHRLQPKAIKYFLRSLAVAPFIVNGTVAGSLNLGDHSPHRYHPGMDTDLLQHMVDSVSSSLSAMFDPKDALLTSGGSGSGTGDQP